MSEMTEELLGKDVKRGAGQESLVHFNSAG